MKLKRLLITVSLLTFGLAMGIGFAGCDDNTNKIEPCENHEWGKWETVTKRTCDVDGVDKRTCLICGFEETRTDPSQGHTWVDRTGKPATCTEPGYDDYKICSKCNYSTRKDQDALGHDLTKVVEGKAATCTEAGWTTYHACTRCDYNTLEDDKYPDEKVLPMLEHQYDGEGEGARCTICGSTKFVATEGLDIEIVGTFARVKGIGSYKVTAENKGVISIPEAKDGIPVLEIGEYAFCGTRPSDYDSKSQDEKNRIDAEIAEITKIQEINLRSIERVGKYAFAFTSSLTKVDLGNRVSRIGAGAFSQSNITTIKIPQSCTVIEAEAFFRADQLRTIEVDEKSDAFEVIDGRYLITKNTGELKFCCLEFEEINGSYSVKQNIDLVIPEKVKSIGTSAFSQNWNIGSLTVPGTVESIGSRAFYACTNLKSVVLQAGVREIGVDAFSACMSLTSFTINVNTVKETGEDGQEVEVPSFRSIGVNAFGGCERLTSITFNGTMAQWKTVKKTGSESGEGMLNDQIVYVNQGGALFPRQIYMEVKCQDGTMKEGTNGSFYESTAE